MMYDDASDARNTAAPPRSSGSSDPAHRDPRLDPCTSLWILEEALSELGSEIARSDGVDADTRRRPLDRQGSDHSGNSALRGRVGRRVGDPDARRQRAHEDVGSDRTGLDLALSNLPGKKEGPCQIHSQDLFPVGVVQVDGSSPTLMAGGMKQDVDRSQIRPGVGNPRLDTIDVRQVERAGDDIASRGSQLLGRFEPGRRRCD